MAVAQAVPFNLPIPEKLDMKGNLGTNWKKFKRVWVNYEIASGLKERNKELRTATLLTCIGSDALTVYDGLKFENEADRNDIDIVVEKFETFCIGQTNEIYERYLFNERDQSTDETIDAYVVALRTLAKTCQYGTLEDELIRDRIVIGIRNQNTRKKLLQEKKLTLQKSIDICRACEKTDVQIKDISHEEVQFVKKQGKQVSGREHQKTIHQRKPTSEVDCLYCGRHHERRKESCPAWGKTCSSCGRNNHFKVKCPGNYFKKVRPVAYLQDESDEEFVLTIAHVNSMRSNSRIEASMILAESNLLFQLDSGSSVNILPEKTYVNIYKDKDLRQLEQTNMTLVMYNKTKTKPVGKRRVRVTNPANQKKYSIEFVIVSGDAHPILGSRACQQMKLITVNTSQVQLEQHLVQSVDSTKELALSYGEVFDGMGKLPGKLHLEIDKEVQPVQIPTRRVPIAIKDKLKDELDRLATIGVLEKVKQPTEWISSMVVVTKPSGKLRICIDPKPLNKALKRNHYPTPTIDVILPELHKARVFSVADAKDGFWHVELDQESSYLTTFGTPWGRYRWKRMPFGISPAPEEFQRRLDEALEGLKGVMAIHDDILVYGRGDTDSEALVDHDRSLKALFERCKEKNLKINKEKLKLRLKSVSYLGHVITAEGLRVDPDKIQAIKEMPQPEDKAAVRRLLGMVNYVQKFAPRISEATLPLRNLLKDNTVFCWDEVQRKNFEEIKTILTNVPVLKYFDPSQQTVLQCDASDKGLGACLMQNGHPVAYASRSLTPTEVNYAQIEKELLAVVFGLEKFENYVYGQRLIVESDHKPLEIICKKTLTSAPKRLQRMLLRLQKFNYEIVYKRGVEMYMADTLSRAYLPHHQSVEVTNTENVFSFECDRQDDLQYLSISDERVLSLQKATSTDEELSTLKAVIMRGWPNRKEQLPPHVQVYFPFREELTVHNGLVFKSDRVIVPNKERWNVIQRLHSGHVGLQSCLRRAKESVYWPKMYKDLMDATQQCDTCNSFGDRQQKEPMISHNVPARPWQKLGCDLFEVDHRSYLLTVDYYSDFFEIDRLHGKTGQDIISKLKEHFARHGIPNCLVSDNGPPFNGKEFQEFTRVYEFEHVTSSPHYPQSNGKAENAVKTAKRLMRRSLHDKTDPHIALLEWRNTPSEGIGSSPAQRLLGRRTRTMIPVVAEKLKPKTVEDARDKLLARKEKETFYYNQKARKHDLSELKKGDNVRIRPTGDANTWSKAVVEDKVNVRSYRIRTEDGRKYRRNRRDLRDSGERVYVGQDEEFMPVTTETSLDCDRHDMREEVQVQTSDDTINPAQPNVKTTRSGRQVHIPSRFKDYQMARE